NPILSVFGFQQLNKKKESISRLISLVDSPYKGLTLCSGSLGSNPEVNIGEIIREYADRIHFAHIRNVRVYDNGSFIETCHRTQDGTVDIYDIVKAYHEANYTGYARPDHGRHICDEKCRPGYSLYDRGMGIMNLWGI